LHLILQCPDTLCVSLPDPALDHEECSGGRIGGAGTGRVPGYYGKMERTSVEVVTVWHGFQAAA
jgi:hypothetical protein